jgi:hypothetical protein
VKILVDELELEQAKITRDIWYTYTKKIKKPSKTYLSKRAVSNTKNLVITDLSRMHDDRVCIFGIDEDGNPIRPVLPYPGIREHHLFDKNGNLFIKPFSMVKFNFIRPRPDPPHTEDFILDSSLKPSFVENLTDYKAKRLLDIILDDSVDEIFGTEIHNNRYTEANKGERSLGTIKAVDVPYIKYGEKLNGKYEYRIEFSDNAGGTYNLPITDCAFRNYCDKKRIEKHKNPNLIAAQLQSELNKNKPYLRVGLTRLFQGVNWLQISGLYTFPDYRNKLLLQ